jgi:hypothetical protein
MWVIVRGGLGNQMFQAAFATALAARFGKAPRYVDLSQQARVPRQWALSCFGISPTPASVARRGALALAAIAARKGHAGGIGPRLGWLVEKHEFAGPPKFLKAPVMVSGYWQGPAYFESAQAQVRAQFQFPPIPADWSVIPPPSAAPRVALHVRRGDFASDPVARRVHLVCDVAWYVSAWQRMRALVPGARAVVFSDDPAWAAANLELDDEVHHVPLNPARPAWADMAQMSACEHFIISNSSFSWWAAYLSRRAGAQVIAPRLWFADRATSELRICPADWLLL